MSISTKELLELDLGTDDGCMVMQSFEDRFLEWIRKEYEENGGEVFMQGVYRAYLHALGNTKNERRGRK